jgi:ABC-type nitrate/sulfonate/bicarbonate transport system ATPase subunit
VIDEILPTRRVSVRLKGKSFGKTKILGPLALDVKAGETLAILGPSGVGKTTLLRLIAGLDSQFEGTIQKPERIAMVFQEPVLLPWRSAIENIMITTRASPDEANRHLADVGLSGREKDFPVHFSLGQQRRLSLARAFAAKPDLLVLDEPFASLDETTAAQMFELTSALIRAGGVTAILVTHSKLEAERLADRIIVLAGSPATVSA